MKKLSLAVRLSALAAAVAVLVPGAAFAQNIATVNGKPVPKARAEMLLQQTTRNGQPRTPELEAQVKEEVVLREIFMQEAERQGIARSPDYKAQMELARQGLMIRELFLQYGKDHPVTDAEIRAEYDRFKAMSPTAEMRASHILVDKEEDAKAVIRDLKAGAKFEDLARKLSKDPGSAERGGDLDWAEPRSSYVPEFAQALMALKKGETTSAPVKSEHGYHVIRLDDTRPLNFPGFDELKPRIKEHLSQQKVAKFREDLKAKAKTDYPFKN
jgi:peptidyl-prolyl cis-trans isomerase C